MYRPKHRRSRARVIGWSLVGLAYAATLVWAASLTAPDTAAGALASRTLDAALTAAPQLETSATTVAREAPLVTLAIAATIVLVAAGWYLLQALPRQRPIAQRARLVVRQITTLM